MADILLLQTSILKFVPLHRHTHTYIHFHVHSVDQKLVSTTNFCPLYTSFSVPTLPKAFFFLRLMGQLPVVITYSDWSSNRSKGKGVP